MLPLRFYAQHVLQLLLIFSTTAGVFEAKASEQCAALFATDIQPWQNVIEYTRLLNLRPLPESPHNHFMFLAEVDGTTRVIKTYKHPLFQDQELKKYELLYQIPTLTKLIATTAIPADIKQWPDRAAIVLEYIPDSILLKGSHLTDANDDAIRNMTSEAKAKARARIRETVKLLMESNFYPQDLQFLMTFDGEIHLIDVEDFRRLKNPFDLAERSAVLQFAERVIEANLLNEVTP